ncbi:hypothetical protein SDC9_136392 [bioreactor metagenome]|uniref:Uncharacterized protein n=1 Tax=bioreactor metagenome TaxID=1076179 RepID=A0A645DIG5_9ZZZZ
MLPFTVRIAHPAAKAPDSNSITIRDIIQTQDITNTGSHTMSSHRR